MSTIPTDLPKILNYQAIALIHKSDRTLVYRALHEKNGQPVIIKLMGHEYPSFSELVQFRNQYAIALNLDIPGIVKTYSLERYKNGYALIMEDIGSISLSDYQQQFSLSLSEFLDIAIQLAEILHALHQNQIIHKDIKPANILIHPGTKEIKLIDFSISSLLPKETQSLQTPNVLEGTLLYLSPEQTGRMNRGIDYRSDFYSLGVTFYELLARKLPFESEDPLELVHAHIAKIPPTIPEIEVPKALVDIVVKLMAKNAEDRYQSALGLKYDLEKCRSQWQETRQIEAFKLGEEDRSDRFLIPEKLYGREAEVAQLLDAFNRVANPPSSRNSRNSLHPTPYTLHPSSEMILVAGFSGIGKTAVVNEVHKPITRQKGYFIKGKYDQFNRNIPFSAFVQAFRDLMGQLLGESDAQLQQWKGKILEAVGEQGQLLIEVIPELERIIGEQPNVPEISGTAAQNRFNLLFEKFIAVFTTQEHPLTLFLDDLQWADSASLNLLKVLMGDNWTGYLLLLGAYRDNEVFPAHPLMLCLADLDELQTTISTITLTPLSVAHINQLIAETLSCTLELAAPLTDLVYQKTKGNPFFTTQFLKALHEDNLITFNLNLGYWECDLVRVRDAALTDDVVEFMAGRLYKLPPETQNVLKLAACIGNQFDLETLAIICETSDEKVATDLWRALREGLILPQSEAYKFFQGWEQNDEKADGIAVGYRFLHDRVQQAAYTLIPEELKQAAHLKIGQLLLDKTSEERKTEKLFDIVNQINIGRELIIDESERNQLASLNLQAGTKAKLATAYTAALKYFETGLGLLPKDGWQKYYSLALKLHENTAEAAYLTGNVERMDELVQVVTVRAKQSLDRVTILQVKMQCCTGQNQPLATIDIARNLLKGFGISLPEAPTMEEVKEELETVKTLVDKFSLDEIAELPAVTDRENLAAASTLMLVGAAASIAAPNLLFFIIFAQVKFSLKYGNSPYSIYGYSCYGMLLGVLEQDIEAAYQFGQLALKLREKSDSNIAHSKAFQIVGLYIIHGKSHVKETLKFFDLAYTSGLESGDFEFAGYSRFAKCQNLYFLGRELSELEKDISQLNQALSSIDQKISISLNRCFERAVVKLLDREKNPHLLEGEAFDANEFVRGQEEVKNKAGLYLFYLNQAILMYLFGYNSQALEYSKGAEQCLDAVGSFFTEVVFYFYDSLIHLACIEQKDNLAKSELLIKVSENQKKLKIWADSAPMNFKHKYDLVGAEERRISGDLLAAMELYDRAIAGAKENGYIQEEALANELAAQFYRTWGKEKFAALYMTDAYYCYARWGAKAKIKDLEERYPQELSPILTPQPTSTSPNVTLSTQTTRSLFDTSVGIGEIFDLASLMKASRTLSREIDRDRAITNLMQVIQENAAAETVALMLFHKDTLILEAKITDGQTETIEPLPIEETTAVPLSIVNTVKRTQQPLILIDASQFANYAGDRYIQQHEPRSVFCLPLQDRGRAIGILYLENNRAIGAFTEDRVEVLSLLCAQAAITLDNASLYQQAQLALQLERDLHELQRTQLQLIQSEKMFSLGQMVGGIAHEINNPVTFIHGNINHANGYMQDILHLLELYQQHYPQPAEEIQDTIEDIDLEFVQEDFQHLLTSMQIGSDRITKIVASLRTFARLDEAEFKAVNLHEGIDSTLTILQSRLQATETRAEIQIIKDYGELPRVECYAGQINQVFLNILNNAIDALVEYEGPESPRISIATKRDENNATIVISDNGTGMNEETKKRVFDPFFTRKEVGEGTGLGMAIAHQIVTEKHGGAIVCHSELGLGTEFAIALPLTRRLQRLYI